MIRIATFITTRTRTVVFVFLALIVLSAIGMRHVVVNYDLASYLPKEVPSTQALEVMKDDFGGDLPNLQVMAPAIDVAQALEVKAKLKALPFVKRVLWLDDQLDTTVPMALSDQATVARYWHDKQALFTVLVSKDIQASDAVAKVRAALGPEAALRGDVVATGNAQDAVKHEIAGILLISLPLALIILLLATSSWLEPFLFLIAIGVGVLLNMGSNIVLGRISFVTQSVAGVLQLAVTMDYAIYLLHRFESFRTPGRSDREAMQMAIVKAIPAVASSAMTTFFGFLALVFMRFGIGSDLGICLAKGVLLSLITVMGLLPVLILWGIRLIDRTTHRALWPSFKRVGRASVKIGLIVVIAALAIAYPAFSWSRKSAFQYGANNFDPASRAAHDRDAIDAHFGQQADFVVLVPRGHVDREATLVSAFKRLPHVTSVLNYTSLVGAGVPTAVAPQTARTAFLSDRYSRLYVTADVKPESAATFDLAESIRRATQAVFPSDSHIAGASESLVDIRDTIQLDKRIVNGLAILAVALVILLTFGSPLLPLLLVLTIEISIWINLAVPYLTGLSINFIGYLVVSTIQLGATVDYAILMSQNYLDRRRLLAPRDAAMMAAGETARTVTPPALILAGSGIALYFKSSLAVVSELGIVLARGALLSLVLVVFLLPTALRGLDRALLATSLTQERRLRFKQALTRVKGVFGRRRSHAATTSVGGQTLSSSPRRRRRASTTEVKG